MSWGQGLEDGRGPAAARALRGQHEDTHAFTLAAILVVFLAPLGSAKAGLPAGDIARSARRSSTPRDAVTDRCACHDGQSRIDRRWDGQAA